MHELLHVAGMEVDYSFKHLARNIVADFEAGLVEC